MRSVCGTPTSVSPTPTLGSLKHPSEMDPMPSLWKDGHFGYWGPFHGLQMSTSCQVESGCLIFISCLICLLLHPPLRLSMGVQEEEVNVVLEDSLRWKVSDHSSRHDSHGSSSRKASVYDVQDTNSDVDWASEYSQNKENNPQQPEDWIIKLW